MTRCPKCGASLAVSVELETDYSKTKAILDVKATGFGADLTNEQLSTLAWKQSQKRPALCTILVNETVLAVLIARLLYDRLSSSANKAWKLGEVTYKLSRNDEGREWLQRWSPQK